MPVSTLISHAFADAALSHKGSAPKFANFAGPLGANTPSVSNRRVTRGPQFGK
jgi:hypothetical protein